MRTADQKPAATRIAPRVDTSPSFVPFITANVILLGMASAVIIILVSLGAANGGAGDLRVWGNVNWVLWVPAFVTIGVPIVILLADRVLDLPAPRLFRWVGIPAVALFTAVTIVAGVRGDPLFTLILIGVIGALLGSVLLDVVRLIGVHVFKAFPLDMPMVFGLIWLGLMQRMQGNMMARMVELTAALPPDERQRALETRVNRIASLSPTSRDKVVRAMVYGLGRLDPQRRQEMLTTQMGILANLEPQHRVAMMQAMDRAMTSADDGAYGQPWGMLRIPLPQFRSMADVALHRTAREAGTSLVTIGLAGYFWHFLNGISLIAPYALIFGPGNWPLAPAWGVFIWLGMMAAMPFMMRMLHFPGWFPIIPFIAHIAMMVPIAILGPVFIRGTAVDASLLGPLLGGR